jgi:hypothetical protein
MVGYSYKITAKLSNGIPAALSNYIYQTQRNNGIYDIYDIIEKANGNAETASRLLNAHDDMLKTFKPFRTFPGGFILIATDYIGNKSFITVMKEDK